MSLVAETLECPNCGAGIDRQMRVCSYCQSPVFVRRRADVNGMKQGNLNKYVQFYKNYMQQFKGETAEVHTALGICLLEKGAYNEAIKHFEKAAEMMPDTGECFYYLALAKLQCKRPYLHTLPAIKQIVQYLDTALEYEEAGKYYYLLSLIQKDFYEKKRLRNNRNSEELMSLADSCEVDDLDKTECEKYCNL